MKRGHRVRSTDIETIAKAFNDNLGLIDRRMARIEDLLRELLGKKLSVEEESLLEEVALEEKRARR